MYSLPLLVEKRLEGGDELQVWRGRDVVVTLQLVEEADAEVARRRVEHLAHGDAAVPYLFVHLHLLEESRRHSRQSVLRPCLQTRYMGQVTSVAEVRFKSQDSASKESL